MSALVGRSRSAWKQLMITFVVIAGASFLVPPAQANLGRVVALGDSFATGTGLGTQLAGSPPICDRTNAGFPEVAMRQATHGEFVNQTCNGATTQALFHGSTALGLPEQTSVLDGSERVVILAVGDNNAHFGEVTDNCLAHALHPNENYCSSNYGSGAANLLPGIATDAITNTQELAPSVGSTLDQIHAKSPNAKIFLVGYMRIAPPDGVTCNTPFNSTWQRSYLNLTPADAPVFAAWEDAVNAALAGQAAGRSYVHFIDMQPASIAHNACRPAAERWVNPFPDITPDTVDGLNLHPSSAGAAAASSALLAAMTAEGLNLGPELLAPIVTRTAPTVTPTTSTSQTITYGDLEAGATTQCKLDTGAYGACQASGFTLTGLSEGLHTFSITQTDSSGNTSSPGSVSWSIDSIAPGAPTVTRTSPNTSPTSSPMQTLTFSGAEGGGTLKCKLDSAPYATCQASPITLLALSDGPHTFSVTQTDAIGNTSAATSVTWTVDAIAPAAPTVTRTSPIGNPTPSTSQTITYSGEAGGTFRCKLDLGAYADCTGSPISLSGLANGSHTYSVTQTDAAGNVSSAGTVSWIVDTSAPSQPTVTRITPTVDPTNSTSQTFTYSGEAGGTFQCKLDAAAYIACPSNPATLNNLSDGVHNLSVTQTDSVGHVGQATTISWTIDATPPTTPIVSRTNPTGNPTNSTAQVISYSGEAGGSFQCKLDNASFGPCAASPVTLNGLSSGTHTYSVTQIDAVGNVSSAGTVSWVVDVSPPPTPTVSGPTGTTGFDFATISYSDSEAGVTFQCKLDAVAYAPCPASPISLTSLGNGAHTYFVTATDPAGNVSAAGAASWTVDPSIFGISITSGPSNPSTQPTASFEFVATNTSGTTYACKLDSGVFVSCASPKNYTSLADGSHTFTVHAVNGVQTTPDVSRTWVVDTTPPAAPSVARTSPTASPTTSRSQTIAYGGEAGNTFECKLDSGPYVTCPGSPVTLTELSLGSHIVTIRQTDGAGNGSSAAAVAWTIEAPAAPGPTIPIVPPDSLATPKLSAKVSAVKPKSITPARTGSPFSLKSRGSVGSFRVTLSAAATISMRLERVVSGASRASTTWTKFKLKSGQTTIYLSGRASSRALPAGTYKVHLTVGGATLSVLGKSFRIER